MTALQKGILGLEIVLAAAILAGLAIRRRYRSSIFFDAYLLSILVCEFLVLAQPERFYTWGFWFTKEVIQTILKIAIAVEISTRAFWRLPRARATAALGLALITAGTLLSIAGVDEADVERRAQAMMPPIFYGTAIMFGLILTLAVWYRVPLGELQKAILMGFTPYLLTFTVGVQLLDALRDRVQIQVGSVNSLAFFGLLGYWLRMAWRTEEAEPSDGAEADSPFISPPSTHQS